MPETFPEYLRRVGRDQAESGRECTAEDYAAAAQRIEDAAGALAEARTMLRDAMDRLESARLGHDARRYAATLENTRRVASSLLSH